MFKPKKFTQVLAESQPSSANAALTNWREIENECQEAFDHQKKTTGAGFVPLKMHHGAIVQCGSVNAAALVIERGEAVLLKDFVSERGIVR